MCGLEFPELETSVWQQYQDMGVRVYGIHPGDPANLVANFIEQTGVTFPIVADMNTKNQFAYPQGVGYPYPRDVVIGKDLTVRSIKNSFNATEMDQLIQALLAE